MTGIGDAGTAMIRQQGKTSIFPYRRVKGGYCGHGLGSLVTCRHLPSVSWRLGTISGLDIPVPGVGSRAIPLPDNTAQTIITEICGNPRRSVKRQDFILAGAEFPFPIIPAEANTMCFAGFLRNARPDATSCRSPVLRGLYSLRRMVFHSAGNGTGIRQGGAAHPKTRYAGWLTFRQAEPAYIEREVSVYGDGSGHGHKPDEEYRCEDS